MRAECKAKVGEILGRRITNREANDMVENIRNAMSKLSRTNEDWGRMSRNERVTAAAAEVAKIYRATAAQKKVALQKQVIAQAECLKQFERLGNEEDIHAFSAVAQILNNTWKRGNGVANEYLSQMLDTITGIGSRFFGLMENAADARDFCREAFGENTGNKAVHQAWLAFDKVARQ